MLPSSRSASRLIVAALARLGAAAAGLGYGGAAQARVTDPTAINAFDLRFEAGAGSPVASIGGTFSLPFRFAALEASGGWGWTGINGSLGLRLIPFRFGPNAVSLGGAGTLTKPLGFEPFGGDDSHFGTVDLAFQRVVFIDKILFIAVGATYGRIAPTPTGRAKEDRPYYTAFPSLRVGWGRRY